MVIQRNLATNNSCLGPSTGFLLLDTTTITTAETTTTASTTGTYETQGTKAYQNHYLK